MQQNRRITLFLMLLLALSTSVMAQQKLSVKSFKSVPEDMTARVTAPVIDQNGDKCALIKVRTTQKGFVFDGDMLGIKKSIQKVGEIWVYVPTKAKKITIMHPQLGVLDSYVYPESIKESAVYIMELICGKVTTIVENVEIPSQYVVINSIPQGAEVYIDDIFVGNTPITNKKFEIGKHTYRIENPLFHNQAGLFELKLTKRYVLEKELKPNYGWAKIETSPESGAEVLIDGVRLKEKTPLKTDKLQSGEHTIIVRKELYKDITRKIIISDNEITDLKIDLDANFGNVKVTSTPIEGAEVILDGRPTGKITPCSFEKLPSGEHTIKLRVQWYEPKSVKFSLADNEEKELKLELKPTFGEIQIKTITGASIYLDNKLKGKEEYKTRLNAGIYTVEARKDKYSSHKQTINVAIGDQQVIELNPKPKYGNLDVVSTPYDAEIYIDGEYKGKTPQTIRNILEGEYKIEIKKSGYGTVNRIVNIIQNKTAEINETLPHGELVHINSLPENANVYINKKLVGKTPLKISLSYGEHSVIVKKNGEADYRSVRVVQNGTNTFNFNVQRYKKIYINSFPSKGKIYLNGEYKGITKKTLNLKYGRYKIKVVDGEKRDTKKIDVGTNTNSSYDFDLSKRKRFFISTNSSIFAPYGIRMGLVVRTGYYIAASFSEKPSDWATMTTSNYDYEVELKDNNKAYEDGQDVFLIDHDKTEPYYLRSTKDDAKVFNYNITAGLTAAINDCCFFYYGLGYGEHHRKYKFARYNFDNSFKEYVFAKDIDKSAEGIVVECGFIFRIKHIALTAGMSTIKFATVDGKLGIGIYF